MYTYPTPKIRRRDFVCTYFTPKICHHDFVCTGNELSDVPCRREVSRGAWRQHHLPSCRSKSRQGRSFTSFLSFIDDVYS